MKSSKFDISLNLWYNIFMKEREVIIESVKLKPTKYTEIYVKEK